MNKRLMLVTLTLVERRKLLGWTIFASILLMIYALSVYPSFRDNTEINRFVDALPETMKSFFSISGNLYGTGAGYLNAELYTMMVPIVVMIVGLALASGTIAGEEDSGRMDLLMSGPITRAQMYLERAAGTITAIALVAIALMLMIMVGNVVINLDIPLSHAAGASFMVWLYGVYYAGMAMAIAGFTGMTGVARGVTSAVAIGSYLMQSLSGIEPSLERFARFTAYHHYMAHTPLVNGVDWGDASMLIVGSAVWFALGLAGFSRRDLR